MVGDLQRIRVYAERGFQIPQEIPDDVWLAYEELVRAGSVRGWCESEKPPALRNRGLTTLLKIDPNE